MLTRIGQICRSVWFQPMYLAVSWTALGLLFLADRRTATLGVVVTIGSIVESAMIWLRIRGPEGWAGRLRIPYLAANAILAVVLVGFLIRALGDIVGDGHA